MNRRLPLCNRPLQISTRRSVPGSSCYVIDLRNNPGGLLEQAATPPPDSIREIVAIQKPAILEEQHYD